MFGDERFDIRARVHTISGYSAHADQAGLVDFVRGMATPPAQVRLIHGDPEASETLAGILRDIVPDTVVAQPAA
jgi:metallo-beta-lactamase family protein